MRRFVFSLSHILILSFVLISGLPILVMGFITVKIISAEITDDIISKNLLLAQSLSSEVQRFLDTSLSDLREIEETIIVKNLFKVDKINSYLDSILKIKPYFESIEILDENATVRFMSPLDENIIGINRSGQQFFSHVMTHKKPYWSQIFISTQTGNPTVTLVIPAKGWVIVGYLNLSSLNAITDRVKVGRHGYAYMTDQDGTFIAHPDKKTVIQRFNPGILNIMETKKKSYVESTTYRYENREYLASLSTVPNTDWSVVVVVPTDEAFSLVKRIKNLFILETVIVVFLASLIAFVSFRTITRPLSRIVLDTRMVAAGDYTVKKIPSGYSEIDEIINNFYTMAGAIKDREEALKKSRETLQAFFDAVNETMVLIDQNGKVLLSNRTAAERLGKTVEEFVGTCIYDYFAPDMAKYRKEQYDKTISSGEPVSFQDASEGRYYEHHCFPVPDGNGVAIFIQDITERKLAEEEREKLIAELKSAIAEVKTLSGLLPICANCKKIRNDKGYWEQIEVYIRDHTDANFSHSICPQCAEKLYPEYYKGKGKIRD
ncbi:MAG: cache domain-containing protein [Thermodesulfovibrionales bacterium]|nr:cache domain-containing protein [Thermodesulfovibrionales bacterium]